jgi:hypothetical protein
MGINYKDDTARGLNTFVVLNPSQALVERIDDISPDDNMLDIHRLILCAAMERWNQYLAHIENLCKDIVSPPTTTSSPCFPVGTEIKYPLTNLELTIPKQSKKAILTNGPQPPNMNKRGFEVRFSDSQRIRDLQDTLIHVSHMLDLNLSIFDNLLASSQLFTDVRSPHNGGSGHDSRGTIFSISTLSSQTKLWKCRVENLLRTLDGSSVLVRLLSIHPLPCG